MSSSERQLAIVSDIILPLDVNTRYDLYFTDSRVAIVCMGKANRFESDSYGQASIMPSAFGVPPLTASYIEKPQNRETIEEEIKDWSIDDLLKLSKKSCFYTYDEIEEVKLVMGDKLKFIISSEECESKFAPNEEQVKLLSEVLPTIEALKDKFSIAGNWNKLKELFMAKTKPSNRDPCINRL
jgi:hypothetical protein